MSIANEAADQLVADVNAATQWLRTLDNDKIRHQPSPDRWSIAEVLGHLVDSCCNNHQRFVRAQQSDTLTFPDYEQNHWAVANQYHDANWTDLVDLWRAYNLQLARVIKAIPEQQLNTICTITPYDPCTLEFLVTDYVVHMNHHLTKIRERLDG